MQGLFIILLFCISLTQTAIYKSLKDNVQNFLASGEDKVKIKPSEFKYYAHKPGDDALQAQIRARILEKARLTEKHLNHGRDIPESKVSADAHIKQHYHMDPVLNRLKRRNNPQIMRRKRGSSASSSSTSLEMRDWKEEFNDIWIQKKFEAINSTQPRGDMVNMAAAKPWGVPCGDPNQHDMPWGNCMMAIECDSEYRIYRGDYFCGRTEFVCCALQITSYDLYQGFDVSFADSSFATDSEEKRNREKGAKQDKKKKKHHGKTKRNKDRRKRKRKIKKKIRNIVREIRKILNRAYRNSTTHRKKRTKILKKYIKSLKSQYKKDRKSIRDIHIIDLNNIHTTLEQKLEQIRDLNKNFLMNSTFRDIVVNGTITKTGARMLVQAYPELKEYLRDTIRRDGGGDPNQEGDGDDTRDYLEYDIEYGALYY